MQLKLYRGLVLRILFAPYWFIFSSFVPWSTPSILCAVAHSELAVRWRLYKNRTGLCPWWARRYYEFKSLLQSRRFSDCLFVTVDFTTSHYYLSRLLRGGPSATSWIGSGVLLGPPVWRLKTSVLPHLSDRRLQSLVWTFSSIVHLLQVLSLFWRQFTSAGQ